MMITRKWYYSEKELPACTTSRILTARLAQLKRQFILLSTNAAKRVGMNLLSKCFMSPPPQTKQEILRFTDHSL
jgi:hypothetical protein